MPADSSIIHDTSKLGVSVGAIGMEEIFGARSASPSSFVIPNDENANTSLSDLRGGGNMAQQLGQNQLIFGNDGALNKSTLDGDHEFINRSYVDTQEIVGEINTSIIDLNNANLSQIQSKDAGVILD